MINLNILKAYFDMFRISIIIFFSNGVKMIVSMTTFHECSVEGIPD
ncbi:hypothetical protein DAPPPG734_24145 (plasmid) [Pantoea agglomerans]|uniref:Uncharacterized protein n=1 Tax=Enterobacter agglomerans TaxID=549 RepID=A0AAN2FHF8_ENTAG|nr:hypothetical protein DAPPPG734_24145 [Pantoea agglomerans]